MQCHIAAYPEEDSRILEDRLNTLAGDRKNPAHHLIFPAGSDPCGLHDRKLPTFFHKRGFLRKCAFSIHKTTFFAMSPRAQEYRSKLVRFLGFAFFLQSFRRWRGSSTSSHENLQAIYAHPLAVSAECSPYGFLLGCYQ